MDTLIFALLLSLFAGLATTIGCVISFFVKEPSPQFISISMGFSAGVMLLVSFVELLQEGIEGVGFYGGMMFLFLGMVIMLIIDVTITHQYEFEDSFDYLYDKENGHYKPALCEKDGKCQKRKCPYYKTCKRECREEDLEKTSLMVFFGVFIHNLPEGMATFMGTIKSVQLGIILAIAIALHNIPEGIAVSVPIYACTQDRKKAFFWSFLSGISEFGGALLVAFLLYPFINDYILSATLAIVAGLMIYISLDELLPVAHSLGKEHMAIVGLMIGMFVMALSLFLLNM